MSRTLIQIFLDTVDTHDKPVQFMRKVGGAWESIPARAALATIEQLALGLEALGVGRGDRVALLSETRLEWTLTDLAVLGLGAVTVPIYPTLTPEQTGALLADCGARVAVVSGATQRDKVRGLRAHLPALETLIEMDRQEGVPAQPGEHAWTEVLARGQARRAAAPDAFRARARAVTPADLATIIYTSGTTGEPKGAMLSHSNIASNVDSCLRVIPLGVDDISLSFLPLSHIFERMGGLYAMLGAGATIAYAESMDLVGQNATEVHPTVLNAVPRFYEKVYARVLQNVATRPAFARALFHWGLRRGAVRAKAHFERRRLGPLDALGVAVADRLVGRAIRARMGGRLRFGVSGGAPLAARTIEFFFAVGIPIIEGYGLTETSPVICLNPLGREKPGAVGPPIPDVEMRIADNGEILTRGPHVMQGYYGKPEATRAAIEGGWFHTGDIGRIDPDGYLTITDRLKDLLVTAGGKKVAPQPIEARLAAGGWIAEAVLLGDQRPFIVALLVPNFARLEAEASAHGWPIADRAALLAMPAVREIFQTELARVNAALASFERVKKFDLLERELTQEAGELTPSLKVKRRVILERYGMKIEALYGGGQAEVGSAA